MARINLDQFKPQPHPLRALFRKHGVTNIMLANYLGKHVGYLISMLSGYFPMSKPVLAKLETLALQLESEKEFES
jgi:hypothetical protein